MHEPFFSLAEITVLPSEESLSIIPQHIIPLLCILLHYLLLELADLSLPLALTFLALAPSTGPSTLVPTMKGVLPTLSLQLALTLTYLLHRTHHTL